MKKVFLLSLMAVTALMSCSKQDSEKVEITFAPESPKVKFVNGKIQTGTDTSTNQPIYQEIKAPWFKVDVNVRNGADKNLILESLKLKMLGLSNSQGVVTVESNLTAESFIGGTGTVPEVLDSVTAGTTSPITLTFYVQGLSTDVTSGVYNVEVLAGGWFGTIDNPTSIFSQKYFFTTR